MKLAQFRTKLARFCSFYHRCLRQRCGGVDHADYRPNSGMELPEAPFGSVRAVYPFRGTGLHGARGIFHCRSAGCPAAGGLEP